MKRLKTAAKTIFGIIQAAWALWLPMILLALLFYTYPMILDQADKLLEYNPNSPAVNFPIVCLLTGLIVVILMMGKAVKRIKAITEDNKYVFIFLCVAAFAAVVISLLQRYGVTFWVGMLIGFFTTWGLMFGIIAIIIKNKGKGVKR
jgi:uncharacterized membrane protein